MTVTSDPSLTGVSVPSSERRSRHLPAWLGWSLALLALVATAVFVTVVIRSDESGPVAPASSHAEIIDNGSPVAVDHAAEVERTTASGAAGAGVAGAGGEHSLIIEYGSPTSVDHAAAEARNG
jgi:hypothetical protein